jgi:RNA polymerase sigma-70 factor (ECF subfamily)
VATHPDLGKEIEVLFRAESEALFRYASTLPEVDRARAEDLVQMTFVAAMEDWSRLGRLGPERQRRWLYRVLKNKAIDQWRQGRHLQLVDDCEEAREDARSETEHQVLFVVALDLAWEMISTMPGQRQRVAFLCWNEEWSPREVAEWLGITQDTVRSHLKLARDQIMRAVGPATPFLDYHGADWIDGRKAGS